LETRILVVLGFSLLGIGVLGGFYLFALLQNQAQVLIPATVVLVFLTWLGSGADFLGLLREWYKDKKEEDKRIANQPRLNILYDPDTDPDTYCPAKSYPNPRHTSELISRKFLRVKIENNGGGIAYQCKGQLRILKNEQVGCPSLELKTLEWDTLTTLTTNQDIGVGDHGILNILFSDDRIIRDKVDDKLIKRAYVSTPHNLDEINIRFPKIEDGFNVGKFEFELAVRDRNGFSINAVFRVEVTGKWDEISMKRIE
jgi:hypothetical protein